MVIASSFFDPVLGLDTHIVNVPAPPVPVVPTPIPMPFVGMVFDPAGLVVGAAMGMALGGSPGVVLVNCMPATNCGTEVTNKLTMPHLPVPGVAFIPPPMPGNDAELYFGSNQVTLGGSFGVRLGDVALSCSDPVRMPTSVVMAIPKGMPVLNMAPMAPDLQAIAMAVGMKLLGALVRRGAAAFRRFRQNSQFFRRLSQRLGGCTPPANASRWRQMWHRGVRFVTGHPVDVVTGNLFTDVIDFELPGPLPLTFERVYESAGSGKSSALGYGWNHSLDESLWMERGRAVVRCGDGREVEFPLWDLPDRVMRPGDVVERVIHKMKLRCADRERFEVEYANGRVHEYAPVRGGDPKIARLVRIRSKDGVDAIELSYDPRGRLEWVRDSAGRLIGFDHDDRDRLVYLKLPVPHGRGWYRHRQYVYDRRGDLVEVKDAAGHSSHYEYQGHLLVRETDRAGLSFYFQYDGTGSSAKCVRTWGDGGIYDHLITYDPAGRKTVVENSLGASTQYELNERNQVIAITDALGATTKYEYDLPTANVVKEETPSGAVTLSTYDAFGNLVALTLPTGGVMTVEYDDNQPVRAVDVRGGEWGWRYDRAGRLVERRLPTGDTLRFEWVSGLLSEIVDARGQVTWLEYDERKNVRALRLPNGGSTEYSYDELGRVVKTRNSREGTARFQYDAEGRLLESYSMLETLQRHAFDPEGNLLEAQDSNRHVRLGYGHFHRVMWREEDGTRLSFEYDTEDRVTAVVNEAGERYEFALDPVGRVVQETGFDGRTRHYVRDRAGQVTLTILPSGRKTESTYDPMGRLVEAKHSDGTFARFTYDPSGLMVEAVNESATVEMERDALGRVVREVVNGREVRSHYDASGSRVELETSLGARVTIGRDALGQPERMFFGAPPGFGAAPDVAFSRDGMGLETRRSFANGIDVEWSRDVAGRPTARRTYRRTMNTPLAAAMASAVAMVPGVASAGAPPRQELDARVYQWRGEDQIAAILDAVSGPRFYDHDRRGRLIRERRPDAVVERAMDAVGNVYRSADGRDRRYGRGGRLEQADGTRYEHDEDGNQTLKSGTDGDWHYRWNGHGMLREVERPDGVRVAFEYDCFARRTAKRVVTPTGTVEREVQFVWDGHNVVHELDSEQGLVTWHWEPETFTPIAKEHRGKRWSIASDHLGTPTEMYDEPGRLAWSGHVDVFGSVGMECIESEVDCPWRRPGQYEDAETCGLVYNRHRFYDVRAGLFLSRDPLFGAIDPPYGYCADALAEYDPLGWHAVRAWFTPRGGARAPVGNPRLGGENFWPNVPGSGANDMAPSGLGRLGDSENLLLEHLQATRTGQMQDGILEIVSVPAHGSSLPPCDFCGAGMQQFADTHQVTVVYSQVGRGGTPVGEPRVYRPGGGC